MVQARGLTGRGVAIAIVTLLTALACTQKTEQDTTASDAAPADQLAAIQQPSQGASAAALASPATAPLADSAMSEASPGASGAGALERVQSETVDLSQVLQAPEAEVADVWIGWYVDRSIDAFRRAIDENKPLVLVIGEGWCRYCTDLAFHSLRCPAIDRFAGNAIFAFSYVSSDRAAAAIASSLDIDAYPTLTVLEPESRMLLERGRINGYFPSKTLGGHFETMLWRTPPRSLPPNWDGVSVELADVIPPGWTPRSAPLGSVLGAMLGAQDRGLKHAPPEPKCQ